MKTSANARGTGEAADGIVKRFYAHGRHPNSLRNLKPQRRGQPSRNPWGRAGKPQPGDVCAEMRGFYFNDPWWKKFTKEMERTQRLIIKSLAVRVGAKPKRVERELREIGLL